MAKSPSLSDTWEYDGSSWKQITTEAAPPSVAKMVYDMRYRRMILVADSPSGSEVETWEYRLSGPWPDELCATSGDEDHDGLADCADPDCEAMPCGANGAVCVDETCQ